MKKKILGVVILSAVVLCTGCAKMPDLTTEQNNVVAEYAANVLVNRSYSYSARYVDDLEPLTEPATEEETESETEKPAIVPVEESTAETDASDVKFNIAKDMGLDLVEVSYEKYKIVDEYPDDPDALFSFKPQEGCQFLVAFLNIYNPSGEKVTLNNTEKDNIVRITINNKRCNNYANLLTNDITRLDNVTIEPGSYFESVVVFMVDKDILESMSEFELSISNGESIVIKK